MHIDHVPRRLDGTNCPGGWVPWATPRHNKSAAPQSKVHMRGCCEHSLSTKLNQGTISSDSRRNQQRTGLGGVSTVYATHDCQYGSSLGYVVQRQHSLLPLHMVRRRTVVCFNVATHLLLRQCARWVTKQPKPVCYMLMKLQWRCAERQHAPLQPRCG